MTDYVMDPNLQSGGDDGTSWENALRRFVDVEALGSSDRLFIKAGVFRNTSDVEIPVGVQIYGGYSPFLEGTDGYDIDSYDERSLMAYRTIFDGQGTAQAFQVGGTSVVLNGLHFINCANEDDEGGALHLEYNTQIIKCVFRGCSAKYGGALHLDTSSSVVTDCTFGLCRGEDSTATSGWGGAIFCDSAATLTRVRISGCTALSKGGAIFCEDDQALYLARCLVDHCHAGSGGGGGIHLDADSTFRMTDSAVNHCTTAGNGGGLYGLDSGEAYQWDIYNCIIRDNVAAGSGDQIYSSDLDNWHEVEYSNIEGGFSGSGGANNIDSAPPYATTGAHPYKVISTYTGNDKADSTAAGHTTTDFLGRAYYDDSSASNTDSNAADIGPYEYQGDDVELRVMWHEHYSLRMHGQRDSSDGTGPFCSMAVIRVPESPWLWTYEKNGDRPMSLYVRGEVMIDQSDSNLTERIYAGGGVVRRENNSAVGTPSWLTDFDTESQGDESQTGDLGEPRVRQFKGGLYGDVRYVVVRFEHDFDIDDHEDEVHIFNYLVYPYHTANYPDDTAWICRNPGPTLKHAPDMPLSSWHLFSLVDTLHAIQYTNAPAINIAVYGSYYPDAVVLT